MRLLKTRTEKLEFAEFWGVGTPLYAILSHTWGPGEITFQEVQKGNPDPSKPGLTKIIETRTIAAAHGFDYVWIDTCCIDKTSSAELSEAINSMYEWYRKSTLCFAYLSDVISDDPSHTLEHSRWFTRGWTLQELIAPSIIVFLDQSWQEIGTKATLQHHLSYITGIPGKVLLDSDPSTASIAQRMSWASTRQTTRLEDQAYCLMGIFGINMPMLYGEGDRAFQRLQEQILKTSDDHTIFAWEVDPASSSSSEEEGPCLLATSPHGFIRARDAIPLPSSHPLVGGITVDNKGIHLHVRLLGNWRNGIAILPCRDKASGMKSFLGLQVRDLSGPSETGEFFRKMNNSLVRIGDGQVDANVHYIGRICIQRKGRFGTRHYSPLTKVAEEGDVRMLETLVEKGARLDKQPLAVAAAQGQKPTVRWLLNRGVRPDLRILQGAVKGGHVPVVVSLLKQGVRPDRAALMWAGRNEEMVRVLFEGGASREDVAHLGLMSLVDGDEGMLRLCLEFGYLPDKVDLEMVKGDETGVLALLFETGLGIGPLGIKGV